MCNLVIWEDFREGGNAGDAAAAAEEPRKEVARRKYSLRFAGVSANVRILSRSAVLDQGLGLLPRSCRGLQPAGMQPAGMLQRLQAPCPAGAAAGAAAGSKTGSRDAQG